MIDIQKFIQRNSKRIIAAGALLFSLFLFALLTGAGPSAQVWLVRSPIAAGSKIQSNEVVLTKVDLGTNAAHFFGAKDLVVGKYAVRALNVGDFLATTDTALASSGTGVSFLPIGVQAADIPTDLSAGDFADLYLIPKDASSSPALVLSHVDIASVDDKSRSLGGSVDVALSVNQSNAALVIDAESQGRLVVAINAF
jgi:hypothetical protein